MKNTFLILVAIAVLALTGFSTYHYINTPKIAFVDTGKLLDGYQAMIDARAEYEDQSREWQTNLDTLQKEAQQEITAYQQQGTSLNPAEKKAAETKIRTLQERYFSYKKAIEEKAAEEEDRLGGKVLTKVNAFLKEYGKKNGYDLVLGSNEVGTILYAEDRINITTNVLDALNAEYAPAKSPK